MASEIDLPVLGYWSWTHPDIEWEHPINPYWLGRLLWEVGIHPFRPLRVCGDMVVVFAPDDKMAS